MMVLIINDVRAAVEWQLHRPNVHESNPRRGMRCAEYLVPPLTVEVEQPTMDRKLS